MGKRTGRDWIALGVKLGLLWAAVGVAAVVALIVFVLLGGC